MNLNKKWLVPSVLLLTIGINAHAATNVQSAIENGLRYLESVQLEYGEFPTTFTPNVDEPQRSLQSNFDSNLFTTAMLSDALHAIKHPSVDRIQAKVVNFLQTQLNNDDGLWSYFTTHNPKPLYPNTIYDLDDTAFASMVLQQNHASFPDNFTAIKANTNKAGEFVTFMPPYKTTDVDCGVNANVLSYLQENNPQVCRYLNEQVAQGKECALYYTKLDAYYLMARAYETGISCLQPSVEPITRYVLSRFNTEDGSVDHSPFKTAIALNTLLSVGYRGSVVQNAEQYLLKTQSPYNGSWAADDFWLWAGTDKDGNPIMMGRSSSSALTTAIVLKALNVLHSES